MRISFRSSFSYPKLTWNCKQVTVSDDHHLGHLSCVMNGIVFTVQSIWIFPVVFQLCTSPSIVPPPFPTSLGWQGGQGPETEGLWGGHSSVGTRVLEDAHATGPV